MQPISKTICDFPTLRQSGCLYVDKTAWLYQMARDPECNFFSLARPRRFGKSLMISTLKAMFQGRKDLFDGLAIMGTDWDWEKENRPVIHLNMGMCAAGEYEKFARSLPVMMENALADAGYRYRPELQPSDNFGNAIDHFAKNGATPAILIDEYDDPVRQDLSALMSGLVADKDVRWAASLGERLKHAQWDKFFDGLSSLYAGAVYGSTEKRPHEYSFGRCLQFLLQGQGFRVEPEKTHAGGRTDLVADHPCGTYVFELKVDEPPDIAMDQVQRRKDAAPYRAAGKPVWAVGLSFDGKTRQFNGGVAEAVK